MSLLITGGAGFIGSNFILEWFKGSSEPVLNLDKLTYAGSLDNLASLKEDPRFTHVTGDIGDAEKVSELLKTHQPRAVINFAAESHVDRSISGPYAFLETNVLGTFRLLESVWSYFRALPPEAQAGFRFLHISTDEVYGSLSPEEPPFSERSRYEPNSPYSASKACSDHWVRVYHHTFGLPTLTTNCSNNYGPRQYKEKLIPLMIHEALAGRELPIYGDGRQIRDWLYVADHCRAIRAVLEKGRVGEVYNVGGLNEKTNLEVVSSLTALLDTLRPREDGQSYAQQIRFVKDRPGHDRRYAIDASKIERELGWRPQWRFEEGLEETLKWYLVQP